MSGESLRYSQKHHSCKFFQIFCYALHVLKHELALPTWLERIMGIFAKLVTALQCEVEIFLTFGYALHVLKYVLGVPTQSSKSCSYFLNLVSSKCVQPQRSARC